MSDLEPSPLFDVIQKRANEIVAFHGVTHGITFTEDELLAIEVGMSSGIHAAIEHFKDPS
jgi:hypothetical protein